MKYTFVVLLLLALLPACDENPVDPEDIRPAFSAGMWWIYNWEVHQTDSAGTEFYQDQDSIFMRVVGIDERLGDLSGLVCVEALSLRHPEVTPGRVWYSQSGDGLREVAYQGAGQLPVVHMRVTGPTRPHRFPSLSQPALFEPGEAAEDTVQWREEPRMVLRYPLERGSQWTAFTVPFLQTRSVIAIGDRELLNGNTVRVVSIATFNAYFGADDHWIDEVCTEGLVSRNIRLNVTMMTQDLTGVGSMTHAETMSLVSYSGQPYNVHE